MFSLAVPLAFFHSPHTLRCIIVLQIKPAVIVDKLIEAVVDVLVPGKGAGESNWFWRNLRSLERDSDRSKCFSTWSFSQNKTFMLNFASFSLRSSVSKELDIRQELRNWDREFPFFHHELIVRYAAGFLASAVAVSAFGQLRSLFSSSKRSRY